MWMVMDTPSSFRSSVMLLAVGGCGGGEVVVDGSCLYP